MELSLATPVTRLPMVGPIFARRLRKLEIETAGDLLYHSPTRYVNYTKRASIAAAKPQELLTVFGTIQASRNLRSRSGTLIQKVILTDGSGMLEATWFNQPFIPRSLPPGIKVYLAGEVKSTGKRKEMISPDYEVERPDSRPIHTGCLVPIYPETRGVSSKWLRSRIAPLLRALIPKLPDWLPSQIRQQERLLTLQDALTNLHFPNTERQAQAARRRLAFDEMFILQFTALLRRKSWKKRRLVQHLSFNPADLRQVIHSLPFKLTTSQVKAAREILSDLGKAYPMNRLLLGDVGSGKTVVAALAIYATYLSGAKSALMAPTEILATQHRETIERLLGPFGLRIAFCTASRKEHLDAFDVLIGTHALLYERVRSQPYGLVVIDEQHRFGVEQRAKLIQKGVAPHTLTMTATPIPRTVALTLYGDLDLSLLDEMPPGRVRIKTWIIPPVKRQAAYRWIRERIREREQAFIVCPLIEESQHESLAQVRAATEEFNRLRQEVFPDLSLGLLHGRLSPKAKQESIERFRRRRDHILVTTPVVEVGIDVPGATMMMIEGAERFGLAQLHQLRGRVGRSTRPSYCLLFMSTPRSGVVRLKSLETAMSGSELAELDLRQRGPGEIFGIRQHGFHELKFTSFTDTTLIERTRTLAQTILSIDPDLSKHPKLREALASLEKPVEPN